MSTSVMLRLAEFILWELLNTSIYMSLRVFLNWIRPLDSRQDPIRGAPDRPSLIEQLK